MSKTVKKNRGRNDFEFPTIKDDKRQAHRSERRNGSRDLMRQAEAALSKGKFRD